MCIHICVEDADVYINVKIYIFMSGCSDNMATKNKYVHKRIVHTHGQYIMIYTRPTVPKTKVLMRQLHPDVMFMIHVCKIP